jgi:hypothetical protein
MPTGVYPHKPRPLETRLKIGESRRGKTWEQIYSPEYIAQRRKNMLPKEEKCKKYYAKHRLSILESVKKWQRNNPEKRKEMSKSYWERNKLKIMTKVRHWRHTHRKECSFKERQRRAKNPEKYRERSERYKKKHPLEEKARKIAYRLHLRGEFCESCGSVENLHFHHTDYGAQQGITLCALCHKHEHMEAKGNVQCV